LTKTGFLELLEQDIKDSRQARVEADLGHIRSAAERMRVLLKDLLELSRVGWIRSEMVAWVGRLHDFVQLHCHALRLGANDHFQVLFSHHAAQRPFHAFDGDLRAK
jgi:signal transduction histidine kinase